MAEKHKSFKIIALLVIIIAVVLGLIQVYTYNLTQKSIQSLNNKIDETSLMLQQQMIQDVSLLQNEVEKKISLLEKTQLKSLDQIELIKHQLTTQELEQENELKTLRKEIESVTAESGDLSLLAENVIRSVVSIRTNTGSGSGVFISGDGTIVTNNHVIQGVTAATIVTYDKKTHAVSLVGTDSINDIAIIKIDSDEYDYLNWGDSDHVKVGQQVIAVGNPRGLDFSVSEGIISAVRKIDGDEFIQIDVPINPGNSGGPLVNLNGDIIGINTFKVAESEGLGFAIPSNVVSDIAAGIIKN